MPALPNGGAKCEFITESAKTNNATCRDITEKAFVAKFFPCKSITEMNFDKGDGDAEQSVPNRDTGVSECTRIEQDKVNPVGTRLLHPVHNFMLCIALETLQVVTVFLGGRRQLGLDVGQTGVTVHAGLTCTQEVQVGAIDKKEAGHAGSFRSFTEDGRNTTSFLGIYAKFNVKTPVFLRKL